MTTRFDYITKTFRQSRDRLADLSVSYTTLFRVREPIDVSDGLLWTCQAADMISGVAGPKPWRRKDRAREVFGGDSPATPSALSKP